MVTQRNVIISLKLAADPKNQRISDQVRRQAEKVSRVSADAARESGLIINQIEIQNTSIYVKESNKRCNQDTKERKKREKSAGKLTKKIQNAEKLRTESQKKAIASGLAAVQGMADMVEGAAKLGLVSEENFEKFSKVHGVIQDGINVFKGAIEMWQAGRETLIALSAATNAQTVANKLMAVSHARTAIKGTRGAAGKRVGIAGQVALGVGSEVVGNALSGGTPKGTVLGGAKVFGGLALGVAKVGAVALVATEAIQGVRKAFGDTSKSSESIVGALWSWRKASKQAEESTKQLIKAEKRRQNLLDARKRFAALEVVRSRLQRDLRTTDTRVNEAKSVAAGETSIQTADRKRLDALREVRAAETAILEDRKTQEERIAAGHFRSLQNELRLRREAEHAQGRLLDAEMQRLAVIRDQNRVKTEELGAEREKLVILKEAQRDETRSLQAKLGQQSPGMQNRLVKIAEKIKSGEEINRRDVSILQTAGVGQQHINNFNAKRGEGVTGSSTFTEVFGTKTKEVKNTEANVEEIQVEAFRAQKREAAAQQQITSAAEALRQATEARVKQEAEIKGVLVETIKGLSQNNTVQQIQQACRRCCRCDQPAKYGNSERH